ncbi:response regulator [Bradyrhizobium sp. 147]|uniref:response regulator n=1 Tax=unclassified Bradyrhizobium TaxID=2631580 RepID=UPI001FF937EE|nr:MULTISPECIES: response regulator [unclassified Bradyrhizobium]MCK1543541.1 response regulator [Bradyrhizobium sp. 179]MCK1622795.1 response regulator [Bradyrhizobium sp. 160]MCK1680868.1 response regulator [Bradyrhizobium sp. 147]
MATSPNPSHQRGPLTGRRIFIVEDEYFLADDIGKMFRALGAEIAGPAGHFEDAVKILHDGSILHGAVLDVNIRSQMIFPIARELKARNIPFVFTTGYDKITIGPEFEDVPLLEKPIDLAAMARKLAALITDPRS